MSPEPEKDHCEPTVINTDRPHGDNPELKALHEFRHAVCAGDLERVKRAITPGLDLNTLFGDGWNGNPALHFAVRNLDVFGFLLALGANPFAGSYPGGEQPLHRAISRDLPETVRLLLDLGADVNAGYETNAAVDPRPTTPLWLAMHTSSRIFVTDVRRIQDRIDIIDILVDHGAEYAPATAVYDAWGDPYEPGDFEPPIPQDEDTLLLKALTSGSRMLWRSYLEKRRGLSLSGPTSFNTEINISKEVRCFLEGFGHNDKRYRALDATGWTRYQKPSPEWKQERLEIASMLLDSREQHDPQDKNLMASLCYFSTLGLLEHMVLVLEKGVDVNAPGNRGETPLLAACGTQLLSFDVTRVVIELLLRYGARLDVRVRDVSQQRETLRRSSVAGDSCLHEWTRRKDTEMLRYLLDAGADFNATNDSGQTVAMTFMIEMGYAIRGATHTTKNYYAPFKILLDAGARVDTTDNRGRTVLHHFASSLDQMVWMIDGHKKSEPARVSTRASALRCLELLIRLGADPGVADNEGKRPVDLLRGRNTLENRACLGSELEAFFGFDEVDSTRVSEEAGS